MFYCIMFFMVKARYDVGFHGMGGSMGHFGKALQWYVITVFLVIAFASMVMADATNSYYWLAPIVLSVMVAYVMWFFWCKDYTPSILITNALVFIGTGIVAYHYMEMGLYLLTGHIYALPSAVWWIVLNAVVGIPAMMIAKR